MREPAPAGRSREYLTRFFRHRSVIALCCCLLTLALAFYGITAGVIRAVTLGIGGFRAFIWFTMITNTLAALTSAFILPFAVEGIRRKRFTLPGWVAAAHYVSTVSITVTMAFVTVFVSRVSPEDAFGGVNFIMHVVCPVMILASFFQMEGGHFYTLRDRLAGCVPVFLYAAVYAAEAALIGEENGGWPDIYRVMEHLPPVPAVLLILLFAFAVSSLIAFTANRLARRRKERMYRYWEEDLDPLEVRIEAYGLGRADGLSGEEGRIQVPLDILEFLAGRYGLDRNELIRPYITGFRNGLREKAPPSR